MKNDPTFWLLARASGLVAYALLTASVLAGLVLKARPLGRSVSPAAIVDIHRFLALLGLGALALHGIALVLDDAVDIGLAALLVPGAAPYRPLATALGVLAAELMVLDLRLLSTSQAHRREGLARAALVHVSRLRARDAPRPRRRHRQRPNLGARALRRRRRRRPRRRSRGACSSHRPKEVPDMYRIEIDRSLCSGFGSCVDTAPELFRLGDDGIAVALVGGVRRAGRARRRPCMPDGRDRRPRRAGPGGRMTPGAS